MTQILSNTVKTAVQNTSAGAVQVVLSLMAATIEAIDEAGDMGAPSGVLYTGLNVEAGISLDMYMGMMRAMTDSGFIIKVGDLYTVTHKGRRFAKDNSYLWKK